MLYWIHLSPSVLHSQIFSYFPCGIVFLLSYLTLSLCNQLPRGFGGILDSFLMVRHFWLTMAGYIPPHEVHDPFWVPLGRRAFLFDPARPARFHA